MTEGQESLGPMDYELNTTSNAREINAFVHGEARNIVGERRASRVLWVYGVTTNLLALKLIRNMTELGVKFMKLGEGNKWYVATTEEILTSTKRMINDIKKQRPPPVVYYDHHIPFRHVVNTTNKEAYQQYVGQVDENIMNDIIMNDMMDDKSINSFNIENLVGSSPTIDPMVNSMDMENLRI